MFVSVDLLVCVACPCDDFLGAAKECNKRSSITFFVLATFRSLFLTLLSLFSSLCLQTPFAGLLLWQGDVYPMSSFVSCWVFSFLLAMLLFNGLVLLLLSLLILFWFVVAIGSLFSFPCS